MTNFAYDDLYGSRFLAAADIKAPVNVVIDRVEHQTFERDGRTKAVIFFKGKSKAMVVNKTIAETLSASFGKEFSNWHGKSITLRPESVMFSGKSVPALRAYPVMQTAGEEDTPF